MIPLHISHSQYKLLSINNSDDAHKAYCCHEEVSVAFISFAIDESVVIIKRSARIKTRKIVFRGFNFQFCR